MSDLDLQEATRRDDTFNQLLDLVDKLSNLNTYPRMTWLYTFDVIKDIFDNNQFEDAATNDYEAIAQGVTLKQIFDKFWDDCDKLGLSLDMGSEIIDEVIRDWLLDNDFLVNLDEEEWVEEEDE